MQLLISGHFKCAFIQILWLAITGHLNLSYISFREIMLMSRILYDILLLYFIYIYIKGSPPKATDSLHYGVDSLRMSVITRMMALVRPIRQASWLHDTSLRPISAMG